MRCGWCDHEAMCCALPGGEGLCRPCYGRRRVETRGYPDCPVCGHRYFLMPFADGGGFRCLGCGAKFNGAIALNDDEERWPPYRHPFVDHSGLG